MNRSTLLRILFTLAALVAASLPARAALTCSATQANLNFGTIDVTQNTSFSTQVAQTTTCSGGTPDAYIKLCWIFNAGSGGQSSGGSPRYMKNGSNLLAYDLYMDAAHQEVWNDWYWVATVRLDGSGNKTLNGFNDVYAKVNAGQQSVVPGAYSSTFSGGEVALIYGYASEGNCFGGLLNSSPTPVFDVTATVPTVCSVSASTLNFGSTGVLTANVDSTTTVSATCTNGTPYTISLSLGSGAGVTLPTARKMTNAGATVTYGLYRDSGRTQGWGSSIGTDIVAATGTGLAQNHTVYGRIPAQTTPAPATYSDSIVVTVTY
ncbi:spore coat protein U domain-containing protein [Aquincola sp. S2]|uniref:Spore coat protein U domain-containing protein n=1 Tax=Pseudaquabacterium terrae TaxID=2732868 RepID=A0ABX2EGW6_9BURK|nr:spore coat protein U domain-containing protein [Aquabacterium terrae]NRF67826.1 spore coat protein U domain-containing protein [Aquabacterium terrae]